MQPTQKQLDEFERLVLKPAIVKVSEDPEIKELMNKIMFDDNEPHAD